MKKEIILPPHLYDRIRASAGEHGGIGAGCMFDGPSFHEGVPVCAHGHAWGTSTRYYSEFLANRAFVSNPELDKYLLYGANDAALDSIVPRPGRISFSRWCELLNVKRGAEVSPVEAEKELAGAVS